MKKQRSLCILLISLFLQQTFTVCSALADTGEDDTESPPPAKDNLKGPGARAQDYDEAVSPDMEHSGSYANRARVALRNGNVSRAVTMAKKAVQLDDDDPDTHAIYAESLQAALARQTEKDPIMFKTCLHEWLIVYRNESGEEKGMTIKGINVMGTFWNDDFRGKLAKINLMKLAGYLPKAWETDNHYINRVTKAADTSVKGKLQSAAVQHSRDQGD